MFYVNVSFLSSFFIFMVGLASGGCTPTVLFSEPYSIQSLRYASDEVTYTVGTPILSNLLLISPSEKGVIYSIEPSLPAGIRIDSTTGIISGVPLVVAPTFTYLIRSTGQFGSVSTSLKLTVNDVPPSGLTYDVDSLTYSVGNSVQITQPSSSGGKIISYSIFPLLPAGMILDPSTGNISGSPLFPVPATLYKVTAINSGGATDTSLTLTILDIPPSDLTYSNMTAVYVIGRSITLNQPTLSLSSGTVLLYTILPSLPAGLLLDPSTGVISGNPSALSGTTFYTLTAINTGGSTTTSIEITVIPSSITYTFATSTYTVGSEISDNLPSSLNGVATTYSPSPALPAGLSLNSISGIISGTPTAITPTSSYEITAINSGGTFTFNLSITVNDKPPSSLTYGTNPVVYTTEVDIAPNSPFSLGGTVLSYSVSPLLPAGLSLNDITGRITGKPTAITPAGDYLITATNSGGSTSVQLHLTVNDVAPSHLTYAYPSVIYTRNSPIEENFPASSDGGVISYGVIPSLPEGLLLDTITGIIRGTPTAIIPEATYKITATNSGGSANFDLTLTVNDIKPTNLTYSQPASTYTKDSPIPSNSPTALGGPVVSYTISPALPDGLKLHSSTGVICGTPTVILATTTYTVTATNTGGSTDTPLDITVNDVAPSSLTYEVDSPIYIANSLISPNHPSALGGAVTLYTVSPALPEGLTLHSSTGILSGTPTTATSLQIYQITASNTGGSTTKDLNITVIEEPPTGLTYTTQLATYGVKAAIALNSPSYTGGIPTLYTVSPSLPVGLSLDPSTGVISGTPTAATSRTTYTVTASNGAGSTTANLDLTISSWVLVSGSATATRVGARYGNKGVSDPNNTPGSRFSHCSWVDNSGNFWLFGGQGYLTDGGTAVTLNDLWKWDGTNWTWVSGESTSGSNGSYGSPGTASSNNRPPARSECQGTKDAAGNLIVFGGSRNPGFLNDIWKWDGVNWTWIGGNNTVNPALNYGALGVTNSSNNPGGRRGAAVWVDSSNKVWVYSGRIDGNIDVQSDLWKWDGTNWTWMGGSTQLSLAPNYGARGVPAGSNFPGGRRDFPYWKDPSGNVWIFGGVVPNIGTHADLWKWDGSNWTWMAGATGPNVTAVYGSLGISDSNNRPASRYQLGGWSDSSGKAWIFGGGPGAYNDLWRWDGNWTWMSGSSVSKDYSLPNDPPPRQYGTGVSTGTSFFIYGGYDGTINNTKGDLWKYTP